ncbi:hypothetical protein LTR56_005744 [Elasticomyces elasticus]|nr:hypothetical protein LTR56_005744 [Elasticomyces elasticus]KAK3657459.1 hypothetical protein LTR22_009325 [Elasticomyces elasticus]KAK4925674.1 hypothetical protein LTR49_007284 [Elasticomyces elasticus]KAK5765006.1 hypothetical protein LTS12_004784 [Elasticomyces elasticus]
MASTAAAHPVTTDNRVLLLFLETLRIHALVTFPIHLHVDFYQRNPGERFNVKFSIHFDAPQAVPWLRIHTSFRLAVISYLILRYVSSPINIIVIVGLVYYFCNRQLIIKLPTFLVEHPLLRHQTGISFVRVYLGGEDTKAVRARLHGQLNFGLGFAIGGIVGVCLTVWCNARLFKLMEVLREICERYKELNDKLESQQYVE